MLPMTASAARHAQRHGGASNECTTKVNDIRCCPTSTTTPWCAKVFYVLSTVLFARGVFGSTPKLPNAKKVQVAKRFGPCIAFQVLCSRLGTLGSVRGSTGPCPSAVCHLAVCLECLERLELLPADAESVTRLAGAGAASPPGSATCLAGAGAASSPRSATCLTGAAMGGPTGTMACENSSSICQMYSGNCTSPQSSPSWRSTRPLPVWPPGGACPSPPPLLSVFL